MQAQPQSTETFGTPPRAVPASGYRAWLACAAVGELAAKAPVGERTAGPAAMPAVPPAPHTAAC
jgi:hypothetical protein